MPNTNRYRSTNSFRAPLVAGFGSDVCSFSPIVPVFAVQPKKAKLAQANTDTDHNELTRLFRNSCMCVCVINAKWLNLVWPTPTTGGKPQTDAWTGRVRDLRENTRHHIVWKTPLYKWLCSYAYEFVKVWRHNECEPFLHCATLAVAMVHASLNVTRFDSRRFRVCNSNFHTYPRFLLRKTITVTTTATTTPQHHQHHQHHHHHHNR